MSVTTPQGFRAAGVVAGAAVAPAGVAAGVVWAPIDVLRAEVAMTSVASRCRA